MPEKKRIVFKSKLTILGKQIPSLIIFLIYFGNFSVELILCIINFERTYEYLFVSLIPLVFLFLGLIFFATDIFPKKLKKYESRITTILCIFGILSFFEYFIVNSYFGYEMNSKDFNLYIFLFIVSTITAIVKYFNTKHSEDLDDEL